MNRSVLLLSAVGAALLAGTPARADSTLPWNDEVGQWFVAPFVGMTFVDDDRLLRTMVKEALDELFPEAAADGTLLLLDGGALGNVPPSTLVDCTGPAPRLIREGALPREELRRRVGRAAP